MMVYAALVLAVTVAVQTSPSPPPSIQAASTQRHGAGTHLTSVLISGSSAVVRGTANGTSIHDGLRLSHGTWRVVCTLEPGASSAAELQSSCGFPHAAAAQLSADEATNAAAAKGRFADAAASAQRAYEFASPPIRPAEAARLQLLRSLNEQMNLGTLPRSEAIIKWNEMRFSFFMP
jgi:hypothetical protein